MEILTHWCQPGFLKRVKDRQPLPENTTPRQEALLAELAKTYMFCESGVEVFMFDEGRRMAVHIPTIKVCAWEGPLD